MLFSGRGVILHTFCRHSKYLAKVGVFELRVIICIRVVLVVKNSEGDGVGDVVIVELDFNRVLRVERHNQNYR